jgi:hypothetical protein
MTVTHGTRSTYNKGCRCDACREASRLARARQRAAATRSANNELERATGAVWVIVFATAAGGVLSLRPKKLKTDDDASWRPAWPWVVAGVILLGIAAGIAAAELGPLPGIDDRTASK